MLKNNTTFVKKQHSILVMCRRLHTAVSMVTVVDWGRDRVHVRNWSDAHTVVILFIVTTAMMAYFFEAGVLAMSSSRQYVATRVMFIVRS